MSAQRRAQLLAEIAGELRDAAQLDLAPALLVKAAGCGDAELATVRRLVDAAVAGRVVKQSSREGMTFSENPSRTAYCCVME